MSFKFISISLLLSSSILLAQSSLNDMPTHHNDEYSKYNRTSNSEQVKNQIKADYTKHKTKELSAKKPELPVFPVKSPMTPEEKKIEKTFEQNKNNTNQVVTVVPNKNDKYSALLQLLQEKPVSEEENMKEETDNFEIAKNNEIKKMLLPIPKKSIAIGKEVIVFAEYRERTLQEKPSSKKNKNVSATNESNTNLRSTDLLGYTENDIEYEKKIIKLEKGLAFGDWLVDSLNSTLVTYKNKNTKEIIKKYY